MPDITIIIVNFFTARLCCQAVRSVRGQGVKVKVVVVDNSVDPEEVQCLRSMLEPFDVEIFADGKNLGFSVACNRAFQRYPAEFILLLNPDAWLLPGALNNLAGFMENNPRAGAASPRVFLDSAKTVFLPPIPVLNPHELLLENLLGDSFRRWRSIRYRKKALSFWQTHKPLRQDMLSGGVLFIRRKALEDAGGLFDERFFMYFEDADLCRRLRKRKWNLFLVPSAEGVHLYDQAPDSGQKGAYFERSMEQYFQKHHFTWWFLARRFSASPPRPMWQYFMKKDTMPAFFHVPEAVREGAWCFEFSPNRDLFPAAGVFGKGPCLEFSSEAWNALKPGKEYFYRFTPLPG